MDTADIKSFEDFIGVIGSHKKGDITLYRGQNDNYPLLPKIARNDQNKDTGKSERQMLDELRRRGNLYLNGTYDDWELLVLAQHYGMATRLLDWTTNPLVALWFSFLNAKKTKSTYVYLFIPPDNYFLDKDKNNNPFKPLKTKVFKPSLNNERIIAQNGWFTAHRYSNKTKSFVALDKNKELKKWVIELKIPPRLRADMLTKLDVLGINHQSIFPGVEGVCNHINWLNEL